MSLDVDLAPDPGVRTRLTPPPWVTAVLVCHDGEAFLRRTLDALDAQTRAPDVVVAVDAGSRDNGPAVVARYTRRFIRLPPSTSFGDAVRAVLGALEVHRLRPAPEPRAETGDPQAGPDGDGDAGQGGPAPQDPVVDAAVAEADGAAQWLWLLHDDSAPAPEALARLLDAVEVAPSVGIAGCKQVDWDDDRRLLDVGFTVSRLGKRVTGVDVGELDMGQHDLRCDVMAVGTAGMLVRREVWESLGGPDPALAHARDDLDLCRRAWWAGRRVVVVPGAVVAHASASAADRRGAGLRNRRLRRFAHNDRRDAVHLRLATVRAVLLPLAVIWTLLTTPLRASGRLVLKQPDRAVDELAATASALVRPAAWWRSRRRASAARRVPRRAIRPLLATRRQLWRARRDAVTAHLAAQELTWSELERGAGSQDEGAAVAGRALESGPVQAEAEVLPTIALLGRRRARTLASVAVAVVPAAVAAAVALRALWGRGTAVSAVLPPVPDTWRALWESSLSAWRSQGLGRPGVADPVLAVLAALAAPLAGSPRLAVDVLLFGALPLAAFSAWTAASALTRSRALRGAAGVVWAGAPSLLAATAQGRVGAVLAHVALPLAMLGLARAVGLAGPARPLVRLVGHPTRDQVRWRRGSVTAASAAGLGLTVVIAGAPSLALPCVLAVVLAAVTARGGRGLLVWTLAVPAGLLLPWWAAVLRDPRLLLADPLAGARGGAGASWWPLALAPGDPADLAGRGGPVAVVGAWFGTDPGRVATVLGVAVVVPIALAALAALVRRDRRAVAAAGCWAVGLAGLAVAVAGRLLPASADGAASGVWAGPGLSLAGLGMLAAAVGGVDGAWTRARAVAGHPGRVLRSAAVVAAVVAVALPAAGVATWAAQGWAGTGWAARPGSDPAPSVHRAAGSVVPAVAAADARGPAATRTLVIQAHTDSVRWSLTRDAGPVLGESGTAPRTVAGPTDASLVLPVLGALLSDTAQDVRPELADLGIGSVFALDPVPEETVLSLDAAPGLERVGQAPGGELWRVSGPAEAPADGATGEAVVRPGRVRVLAADGSTVAVLPSDGLEVRTRLSPGAPGRRLVLAERADPGWHARLGGRELPATTHAGWAQAFELPLSGGRLEVTYRVAGQGPVDAGRAALLGLAALVALPLPRRRPRGVRAAARWAAGPDPLPAAGDPQVPAVSGAPTGVPWGVNLGTVAERWVEDRWRAQGDAAERWMSARAPSTEDVAGPDDGDDLGPGPRLGDGDDGSAAGMHVDRAATP